MIILDTDVLSALMLSEPDEAVASWLDRQARNSIWTTSVTLFEIRYGLEIMPTGRRRSGMESAFARLIREKLESRVVVFDEAAADAAAILMGRRRRNGQLRDTMVAGIALAQRAALATRNVRHFDDIDVTVVNPWKSS